MIKSGEESGKLEEIFIALADHLERSYELANKTKNALIYPAFVVVTFFAVMILMLTFVIPKLTSMLTKLDKKNADLHGDVDRRKRFLPGFWRFLLGGAVAGGGIFVEIFQNGKREVWLFQDCKQVFLLSAPFIASFTFPE